MAGPQQTKEGSLPGAFSCIRDCKIISILSQINSTLDLDQLLGLIMATAAEVVSAETASLLLLDETGNELVFKVALGEKGTELKEKFRLKLGEGIAGTVAQTGRSIIVNDASQDPRFAKRVDDATHFQTKAILCVPIKFKDNMLGVLEAINPVGREGFSANDLALFEIFASQAAISIENARLHTDHLTRLFIREYFVQKLHDEFVRFARFRHPFSLAMIDVDHFKKVNDSRGHRQGDVVLQATARLIKLLAREVDIACRYGGEEFVVILPETDSGKALKFAERVRRQVDTFDYPSLQEGPLHVTVSLGVATCPDHASTQEELIERADVALYDSKRAGRNRCSLYSLDSSADR